jgi:tRNA-dihydrouridine synthase 2
MTRSTIFLGGKTGLAPMVRVGTIHSRIQSLRNGADFVWSEELIDIKLATCKRVLNPKNNTVDFLLEHDTSVRPVFQTTGEEKGKVILQLGSSDPEIALKAAKLVENDVAAVEINMGCPKEYSTKAGMGAAMLQTPELAASILKNLVDNLKIPVTCKIRCLKTVEETAEFCRKMADTGISLLSIHGRERHDRPRHPCKYEKIAKVTKIMKSEYPDLAVWANGVSFDHVNYRSDIDNVFEQTGCDGVMLARVAFRDPSVFNRVQKTMEEYTLEYVKVAIEFGATFKTMKYVLQEMLCGRYGQTNIAGGPIGDALRSAETVEAVAAIWGVDYVDVEAKELADKEARDRPDYVISENLCYDKKLHNRAGNTPKQRVQNLKYNYKINCFKFLSEMRRTDGKFQSKLLITNHEEFLKTFPTVPNNEGKLEKSEFTSTYWDRNRRMAEQSVSVVFMTYFDQFQILDSPEKIQAPEIQKTE